jgi:hypothetical protein
MGGHEGDGGEGVGEADGGGGRRGGGGASEKNEGQTKSRKSTDSWEERVSEKDSGPPMSIALFSHEIEEGQRKQNQKIKGRYTAAANQKDSSGDRSISELRRNWGGK